MFGLNKLLQRCGNCGIKVPRGDGRVAKDGKTSVCIDCYEFIFGKKTLKSPAPQPKAGPVESPKVVMVCQKCKYRFRVHRKPTYDIACPYCSSNWIHPYVHEVDKILGAVS